MGGGCNSKNKDQVSFSSRLREILYIVQISETPPPQVWTLGRRSDPGMTPLLERPPTQEFLSLNYQLTLWDLKAGRTSLEVQALTVPLFCATARAMPVA